MDGQTGSRSHIKHCVLKAGTSNINVLIYTPHAAMGRLLCTLSYGGAAGCAGQTAINCKRQAVRQAECTLHTRANSNRRSGEAVQSVKQINSVGVGGLVAI